MTQQPTQFVQFHCHPLPVAIRKFGVRPRVAAFPVKKGRSINFGFTETTRRHLWLDSCWDQNLAPKVRQKDRKKSKLLPSPPPSLPQTFFLYFSPHLPSLLNPRFFIRSFISGPIANTLGTVFSSRNVAVPKEIARKRLCSHLFVFVTRLVIQI